MRNKDLALLSMRIILFAVFMYHGLPKAFDWGLATTKFVNMGFPGFLGPIIGILEVIGAVTLLLGIKNRETNFILGGIITVAIVGVQIPSAINKGVLLPAGLERDLLMLGGHYLLFTLGAGTYKIKFLNKEPVKAHA